MVFEHNFENPIIVFKNNELMYGYVDKF